jgi:hypothetical protein
MVPTPCWNGRIRAIRAVNRGSDMAKPILRVIAGDAKSCPAWLDFPATVVGRSPFDRSETCRFRLSREDVTKAALARRLQPIWEFWSIVVGQPPPVPNVKVWGENVPAEEGLTTLVEAHACFRGIRRALAEDDNGTDVIAYVLRPHFFYEHSVNLVCAASKRATPHGLVYVVHARLDVPAASGPVIGVVTHGGFVETELEDGTIPKDHSSRYNKRLW